MLLAAAALASAAAASAALSPTAYHAAADAACTQAKTHIRALAGKTSQNPAKVERYRAAELVIEGREYATLRALEPPASLLAPHRRALWDLWLAYVHDTRYVQDLKAGEGLLAATKDAYAGFDGIAVLMDQDKAWTQAGASACVAGGISGHVKVKTHATIP